MKGTSARLVAACVGLAAVAPAVVAQVDYRNLDGGRPLRVADATAIERYAFEVSLPWRLASGRGSTTHTLVPELEYGFARDWVVGVELELVANRAGSATQSSHLGAFLFYNARRETPGAPALSIEVEVGQPFRGGVLDDARASTTLLATRSVGRSRVHANGSLAWAAGGDGRWWAGIAWDHTLYRTSTLLAAELSVEDQSDGLPTAWVLGAGVRRQLTPTLVLHAGASRMLRQQPGATRFTFGVSHVFGIAALMPGRPR